MSELELPARQEKFCRHYMLTGDGTRSAVIAGYSPRSAPSQASRMLRNDKIRRRLAELRGDFRRDFNYDRGLAMARLEALYRHALRKERFATAIRATELQARLAGLLAEPGAARRSLEPSDGPKDPPNAAIAPLRGIGDGTAARFGPRRYR